MHRYRLEGFTHDATLRLGREKNSGPYVAAQVAAAPGAPRTAAVARAYAPGITTTPGNGAAIFDDGAMRPGFSPPQPLALARYGPEGLAVLLASGRLLLLESPAFAGP